MNSTFWTSSVGKTIRWITFFPAAIIAALCVGAITILINTLVTYFTGDSVQWAYVGAAVFSWLTLMYVAWYIIPSLKKLILYILFGLRVLFSILWFVNPEYSPLNVAMLITQELFVIISNIVLIIYLSNKKDANTFDEENKSSIFEKNVSNLNNLDTNDILDDLGYKNNFEMIADIVSNLYYYFKKEYNTQMPDSTSRLIACGILDTLYQINIEKSITVEDIVGIAMSKVQTDDIEELIEFIIELQILIFKVEEPQMEQKQIIEEVNNNIDLIREVVNKNSHRDNFSVQTTQSIHNFMHSENFKPVREFLQI